MRFLVDESTGPAVARWLKEHGHDATSVYDEMPGAPDQAVLSRALDQNRILITSDKDFGEMIYRDRRSHCGVLFLRLVDERTPVKLFVIENVLARYADALPGHFVVASEDRVRIAEPPPDA